MRVKIVGDDGTFVHCQTEGSISQDRFDPTREPLAQALGEEVYSKKVLLGLDGSTFVDSSGVNWLLRCHKRFREAGGRLILHSATPLVSQTLRVLKLDRVFYMADNLDAARALAGESQ